MKRQLMTNPAVWVLISFAVWIYCFKGYLCGRLGFTSDALSYYDHIRYFITNLMQGNFSLWDPYWSGGVPNDFFLRRICPYNPFYSFIIALCMLGCKYYYAYVYFLIFYLFFGMWGFYLLCRKITGDSVAAFTSFLLLLFSALSTRVFDSYMMFVVTPLAWFYYCLVSFALTPSRKYLIGLSLFTMLLGTTYIPLYFFLILATGSILYLLTYPDQIISVIKRFSVFAGLNRVVVFACALAIALSLLPGILFFQEAGKGGITIPGRSFNAGVNHALAVQNQAEDSWAVPEEFFFSAYYNDLTRITFAIVYVPCFAFILLLLGGAVRVSRLMIYLLAWEVVLFLLTSPFGSPLYAVMREHVFIIKYFRNLHFLLWFIMLPLFALFVGELLRSFRNELGSFQSKWFSWWIVAVHLLLMALVLQQPYSLLSTKISILLSAFFFLLLVNLPSRRASEAVWYGGIFLITVLQPLEVYSFFSMNVPTLASGYYDQQQASYSYTIYVSGEGKRDLNPDDLPHYPDAPSGRLYYATAWYNNLRENIPLSLVAEKERTKFWAYDRVIKENESINWGEVANKWKHNENQLLIESAYRGPEVIGDKNSSHPMRFENPSPVFSISKGSTDRVELKTDFPTSKVLVFTDSFYPGWRASINGRSQRVWRVDGAYKGVVVPSGQARVVFEFGTWQKKLMNWGLLIVMYLMALATLYYSCRKKSNIPERNR